MSKNTKPRGLGRGLNALFDDDEELVSILSEDGSVTVPEAAARVPSSAQKLGVEQLEPGMSQPRMDFDADALESLAASIKLHGILQPLLVRPKRDVITDEIIDGRYEIIAGERRWRAAQLAQLHDVPVVIRDFEDRQAMQIALIENLQREDLNPVEEALAYQRLLQDHDYTQAQLAEALGKSRSHIANMTRMLNLPEPVLDLVRYGELSAGHVRALITFDNPLPLAEKILAEGMSVRAVERYVAQLNAGGDIDASSAAKQAVSKKFAKGSSSSASGKDADLIALEKELSDHLGMALQIDMTAGSSKDGTLRVSFKNLDQLDHLIALLMGKSQSSQASETNEILRGRLLD